MTYADELRVAIANELCHRQKHAIHPHDVVQAVVRWGQGPTPSESFLAITLFPPGSPHPVLEVEGVLARMMQALRRKKDVPDMQGIQVDDPAGKFFAAARAVHVPPQDSRQCFDVACSLLVTATGCQPSVAASIVHMIAMGTIRLQTESSAAVPEPDRTEITTDADLDALPFLSLVREKYLPSPVSGTDYGGVWERRSPGWGCLAGSVMPPGHNRPRLPVTLLWMPS